MMKTKDLSAVTSALIEKMKADGYSQSRIEDTTWILEHFRHYCIKHDIGMVTVPVAVGFIRDILSILNQLVSAACQRSSMILSMNISFP